MSHSLLELFKDKKLINKVKERLPKLFHLAELECSRAGKIGMEVGSVREKIIIALLMYKFGEENIEAEIPITESEVDVKVFNKPISIKTITGKNFNGIKLIWTVDAKKALNFSYSYKPSCDMILIQINWANGGGFYFIPLSVQKEIFEKMGTKNYIKLPIEGTNPRGVEMTKEAMKSLVHHNKTLCIPIN